MMPVPPHKPRPDSISADALTNRIDKFLATRGLAPSAPAALESFVPQPPEAPKAPAVAETFVCEEDVRLAAREGRTLLIGERTIVTPSARDAGEAAKVFVHAGWLP